MKSQSMYSAFFKPNCDEGKCVQCLGPSNRMKLLILISTMLNYSMLIRCEDVAVKRSHCRDVFVATARVDCL